MLTISYHPLIFKINFFSFFPLFRLNPQLFINNLTKTTAEHSKYLRKHSKVTSSKGSFTNNNLFHRPASPSHHVRRDNKCCDLSDASKSSFSIMKVETVKLCYHTNREFDLYLSLISRIKILDFFIYFLMFEKNTK